jgi:hypothetical protein
MEIYDAIMKAADQIEWHPETYAFYANEVPGCCTKGCLLGWIGYFMGVRAGADVFRDVAPLVGLRPTVSLVASSMGRKHNESPFDTEDAARILRRFAERYKPVPLPHVDLPAKVRAIFDAEFVNTV